MMKAKCAIIAPLDYAPRFSLGVSIGAVAAFAFGPVNGLAFGAGVNIIAQIGPLFATCWLRSALRLSASFLAYWPENGCEKFISRKCRKCRHLN